MTFELNISVFGRPDLLQHQIRLLNKYILDDIVIRVVDNTPGLSRNMLEKICENNGVSYTHIDGTEHNDALNYAALHVTHDYFGFIDHDIFPMKPCRLIDKIERAGFYGLPQTHKWTAVRYLWPGFCFFSREWLGKRKLNFDGIRANEKEYDGDCGSMNFKLFKKEDWNRLYPIEHSHKFLRDTDDPHVQSWGYEIIGDFMHFTNASHWLQVENPLGRDRLLIEMLNCM